MNSNNQHETNCSHIYRYNGGQPDCRAVGITHVIVNDGVESINDRAFQDWNDLVCVYIPSSVRRIGLYAFCDCKSLSTINLPESLQQIDQYAFCGCARLPAIVLPHSLNEIGRYAFRRCTSLVKISTRIPPLITRIQQDTFLRCSSVSEVIIPPSVIYIKDFAFECCHSLKSIKLPNGIQTIGDRSFDSCTSLESIQIPPSTIRIGVYAFRDCSSLKVIYTPSTPLQRHYDELIRCDSNLIILTDVDEFEYKGRPSITLNNIHQCIQDLPYNPNNPIPSHQQLQTLHQVLHQRFPNIANRAQHLSLTLLHLIVYFPGDIYEPLSTILTSCPEAITAVDSNGKTPIHHVITSTRHNMHPNCYNLLMRHCPDTVVHQAIRAGGLCWDDLQELVRAKIDSLTLEDVESGLLPFMLAATSWIGHTNNDDGLDLSVVYELLCMNPGVLLD